MPKTLKTPPKANRKCIVCGQPRWNEKSKYCQDCSKIYRRMRNKGYPPEAVKGIWDYIRKYGKVCCYTGIKLDLDDSKSPRYLVFDHWIPGDPRKIVLASALANEMKSDMTQDEFEDTICQMADHFRKGTPVVLKPFVYWYRLYPQKHRSAKESHHGKKAK